MLHLMLHYAGRHSVVSLFRRLQRSRGERITGTCKYVAQDLRPRLLRSTFSFSKSLVILNFCKILVKSTEYNNETPPKQVTKSLVIY